MAQLNRNKPRIRKAAPTVRDQIEVAKKSTKVPTKQQSLKDGNFKSLSTAIGTIFRPLVPLFRSLAKVLNWILPRYFINSWRELRQVTWPNRRETWRLTGAVFIFAVVFGGLVAVVDKGLDEFFKKVILKQ